ncbi:phosphatidylinositol 3,4,5-trisphosphate 3-phosphatase TPTE2-like [Ctenodactylus gundi]
MAKKHMKIRSTAHNSGEVQIKTMKYCEVSIRKPEVHCTDKPNTGILPSSGLNTNNSADPEELPPLTYDGVTNERPNGNELMPDTHDENSSESLSQNKKTPVTFVESVDEMLYENELISYRHDTTINERLYENVLISDRHDKTINERLYENEFISESDDTSISKSLSQNKKTSVTFAKSLDEMLYENEFISESDDTTIRKRLYENELSATTISERLAILFRPLRLVILMRVFRLAHQKRHLQMLARRLVSENKRRYQREGFDLDLTYITDRIIAMSFPSSGRQSLYRNPIEEVARFLDTKHANHYQVYNLCSERTYDPKYFHYRVHRIKIDDHNVPTLKQMLLFSKEVQEWMAQDEKNIVVIHCKGGKGRTGTMVCTCLIASEHFLTAKDSTYYFGERRTDKSSSTKFQGIETPSQNRYVGYFEKMKTLYNWNLPPIKILWIKRFIIYSIHGVGKGNGSDLKVEISMQHKTVFPCSSANSTVFHDIETDRVIIEIFNCPALYDDVKVKFLSPELPKYYDNCSFFFWFHTSFIEKNRLYLPRKQLDNPHKSKTWKIYNPKFAVEVYFNETSPSNADFVIT